MFKVFSVQNLPLEESKNVQSVSTTCTHTPASFAHHLARWPLHQLIARAGTLVILNGELACPVHSAGSAQPTAAALEEVHRVAEAAVIEWALNGCGSHFKVLVSPCIHPFIGCYSQARNLVELTHEQDGDPGEVEEAIDEHPEDPGRAHSHLGHVCPEAIRVVRRVAPPAPEYDAPVDQPAYSSQQEEEVANEIAVVSGTHAVADPGTVVIELGNTAIAHRAVLGPHWLADQTCTAEYAEIQAPSFS